MLLLLQNTTWMLAVVPHLCTYRWMALSLRHVSDNVRGPQHCITWHFMRECPYSVCAVPCILSRLAASRNTTLDRKSADWCWMFLVYFSRWYVTYVSHAETGVCLISALIMYSSYCVFAILLISRGFHKNLPGQANDGWFSRANHMLLWESTFYMRLIAVKCDCAAPRDWQSHFKAKVSQAVGLVKSRLLSPSNLVTFLVTSYTPANSRSFSSNLVYMSSQRLAIDQPMYKLSLSRWI